MYCMLVAILYNMLIYVLCLLSNQYTIVAYITFVVAMNCSWMVSITLCACTKSYSSWLVCISDGGYQNFSLSIIARLIATIMAIIAIPTAKCRNQKKDVSVQYTVS